MKLIYIKARGGRGGVNQFCLGNFQEKNIYVVTQIISLVL